MFLEYDWLCGVYRPRFGASFIAIGENNVRFFPSMENAKDYLAKLGLKVAGKSASRTWRIIIDKRGATTIEYALIAAVIGVALTLALGHVAATMARIFGAL